MYYCSNCDTIGTQRTWADMRNASFTSYTFFFTACGEKK